MAETLETLYAEMSEFTAPICAARRTECGEFAAKSYRCCERRHCESAREFARMHYGLELQDSGNPELPFMSARGCTVFPHLRPRCTLHLCSISWAGKSSVLGEAVETEKYFRLRERILELARVERKEPTCPS